jgi:hypothetical protein
LQVKLQGDKGFRFSVTEIRCVTSDRLATLHKNEHVFTRHRVSPRCDTEKVFVDDALQSLAIMAGVGG